MLALTVFLFGLCSPQDICLELQKVRSFDDTRLETCYRVVEVAEEWELDPLLMVRYGVDRRSVTTFTLGGVLTRSGVPVLRESISVMWITMR